MKIVAKFHYPGSTYFGSEIMRIVSAAISNDVILKI
jgi:hypothetical protein